MSPNKIQQALKYFSADGIEISSNKKYVTLADVTKKYFDMTESDFMKKFPGVSKMNGSKKVIAPGKLLKCLAETTKGKEVLDKINGRFTEETKRIIDKTAAKSKNLIKTASVERMVGDIRFDEPVKQDIIRYRNGTIKIVTEENPDMFYTDTKCPPKTLTVLKKLNLHVYRVLTTSDYVVDPTKYVEIFTDSFPFCTHTFKSMDDVYSNHVILKKESIDNVMNVTASNAFTYSFQRQMSDNNPKAFKNVAAITDVKKKTEFESLHYLYMNLSSEFMFKYQVKVGSYYIDCVIIPKGQEDRNMINVCVEIDENNHSDRNPKEEHQREQFIKAAGLDVYRIPVKTTLTSRQIKAIIDEESNKITELARKNYVLHSPAVILKMIKEYVIDNNIHDEFVSMFFREVTKGNPFIYSHEDIGRFLGFSEKENYRSLTTLIENHCRKKIDYIVTVIDGKYHYYLTRLGFNYICSTSATPKAAAASKVFSEVYELTTQLTTFMMSGVPDSLKMNLNDKSCVIEAEILRYIEKNVNKENIKISTLEAENSDIKKRMEAVSDAIKLLDIENQELRDINDDLSEENVMLKKKVERLSSRVEQLEEENEVLVKQLKKKTVAKKTSKTSAKKVNAR